MPACQLVGKLARLVLIEDEQELAGNRLQLGCGRRRCALEATRQMSEPITAAGPVRSGEEGWRPSRFAPRPPWRAGSLSLRDLPVVRVAPGATQSGLVRGAGDLREARGGRPACGGQECQGREGG